LDRLYKYISFFLLLLPFVSFAQQISNIQFAQVGKQVHIYYDLHGEGTYNVKVHCSTNDGRTWGQPLQKVTGDVGANQQPGVNKEIIWDVLAEREKIAREIRFKIEAASGNTGYFTDARDGQTYKWVKIGNQVWMAENLNYNTGNSWCYDNVIANCNKYGRLYDWETAIRACPKGWHLPSDDEWKTLEMDFGMSQREADDADWRGTDEGKKLKSTSGWYNKSKGSDKVGFSALPGGYRSSNGDFRDWGDGGYWWSATAGNSGIAWLRVLSYNIDRVFRTIDSKGSGFSVRCVRD
jgi:uncharacterized protein (TIGR02145 family)